VHTALGEGSILWDEMFNRLARLAAPPLLSIEIPTRMRRDSRGRIVLEPEPMPLAEVDALLGRSIAMVDEQIARVDEVRT